MNKRAVFSNNEMSLRYIDVYGFDYDFTLASYSNELHHAIYRMAVDNLITFGVCTILIIVLFYHTLDTILLFSSELLP